MRVLCFDLGADKLLTIRFGESSRKPVDEFWTDFKPDGGEKTTMFMANIRPDTEHNRLVADELKENYKAQKQANDEFDKKMYQIRNKFER